MKEINCQNCIHHFVCKYYLILISSDFPPAKGDEEMQSWHRTIPKLLAVCCDLYKAKE